MQHKTLLFKESLSSTLTEIAKKEEKNICSQTHRKETHDNSGEQEAPERCWRKILKMTSEYEF